MPPEVVELEIVVATDEALNNSTAWLRSSNHREIALLVPRGSRLSVSKIVERLERQDVYFTGLRQRSAFSELRVATVPQGTWDEGFRAAPGAFSLVDTEGLRGEVTELRSELHSVLSALERNSISNESRERVLDALGARQEYESLIDKLQKTQFELAGLRQRYDALAKSRLGTITLWYWRKRREGRVEK